MSEFKFPTEVIDLPSKGLIYPESSPLSSGTIELKYMSAKEEDILTNVNFIEKGIIVDKLLQSLIVSKINYSELITGDKNAILVAARILGFGAEYPIEVLDKYGKKIPVTINLSELKNKPFNESLVTKGVNEFAFKLPHSSNEVTFKILTGADERKIEKELEGLKKISKDASPELTTRLKHMITSVNGKADQVSIRDFVDNYLLAPDSRAFKKYYSDISPDIDTIITVDKDGYVQEGVIIPININFFWPDA